MLEWLLTGHNLIGTTVTSIFSIFLVGFALSTICEGETKTRKRLAQFFIVLPMVISVVIVSVMLYIRSNTTEEYIHDSEWKVIYTNDIDAKVDLKLEVDKLFGITKRITAGELLTNTHNVFKSTKNGTLTATKGNSNEKKKIHLDKSNVIINGPLSSTSKITKVEYRQITSKRNTAFGKYGSEMTPDVDGEVRVTIESIEDENTKKLKALFGE